MVVDSFLRSARENPHEWCLRRYDVTHTPSGLVFDLCYSPWVSVDEPFIKRLGLIQSIRFLYYVNRLKAWKAQQMIEAT